jgi:hypothetical protein
MITKVQNTAELGDYVFDVAVGKRNSNDIPLFSSLDQVQPTSATLDTEFVGSNDGGQAFQIKQYVSKVDVVLGLNSNPLVHIVAALPFDKLFELIDFGGFAKNGVLGVRFRKEQFSQSTDWVYGTIPYAVPRLEPNRRNVMIEGYGLLFEAPRRQVSRSFANQTAQNVIRAIAGKYKLGVFVKGSLQDKAVNGPEQNESDFSYLNRMAAILDAYWYMDATNIVLLGRSYLFSQTPEIKLTYGTQITENFESQFPIYAFTPSVSADSFEAGALMIRAAGIDLDTGAVVKKDFKARAAKLGSLALNSDQFLSDAGVTINGTVVKPAPELTANEAGLILPFRTRGNDEAIYQFSVEHKDMSVRAHVACPGIPKLRPGDLVSIDGVGEMFGGNWLVEEVTHSLGDDKGYNSSLALVRNALGQVNVATGFSTNMKSSLSQPESTVTKFAQTV